MFGTDVALLPLLACPLGMAAMAGVPAVLHRVKRRRTSRPATDAPALPTADPSLAEQPHEAEAA
jgi:hypothetical protein